MRKTCLFSVALAVSVLAGNAYAETLKVAVAQRGFWNSTFVDIAEKQGYFKEAGLTVEVFYTEGGASTLQPLIAGSVDVAMSNGTLGLIGAYAKGMPVRVISAEGTGAPELFWYVKSESSIHKLQDAKGKTVAFSSPGSSTNLVLLQLVKQENVQAKLVPTGGVPATFTQVLTGQIDVGWSVPPFGLKQIRDNQIRIIARGNDAKAVREQTIRVNVANANALAQKRDAFKRYIHAISRAIDWAYSSPDAIPNYAAIAKVTPDIAREARDNFFPKEEMQLGEIKGLDLTLQQALDFKYITKPMTQKDVAGLFDILYEAPKK